jgi:hypothetical protein
MPTRSAGTRAPPARNHPHRRRVTQGLTTEGVEIRLREAMTVRILENFASAGADNSLGHDGNEECMDLPEDHATVLRRLSASISDDERFIGLAAGGSLLAGAMDWYSDLDLLVVVDRAHHAAVMSTRQQLAGAWGKLLAAFTGEHVGEPRLLICLYDDPMLHVDFKFVTLDELEHRIEDPVVLWERDSDVSAVINRTRAAPLRLDVQWIEDRFWVWVHYAATKLGRGELFEVIDFLSFLRGQVLAPLYLAQHGEEPRGVRRLEQRAPTFAAELERTVAGYDRRQCAEAVQYCIELYRNLRDRVGSRDLVHRTSAEQASTLYLAQITDAA